jgi:hypothetical protein
MSGDPVACTDVHVSGRDGAVIPGGELACHQGVESMNSFIHSNGGLVMFMVISANALLVWFVWGFFMALGWALGTWIMERLFGMVWRDRVR